MSFSRSDLAWVIDLATLIAVIAGLSFAAIELRQLRAAQESQTMLELFQTVKSLEYIRATNLIQALPDGLTADELRARLSEEELGVIIQLRLTYEALGLMVYRGDVSLEWVDELFRFFVLQSWDKLKPLTYETRERTGYLGWNEWHQWLAERLRERNQAQPVPAYEAFADWTP
jgi:hypothetical protein